VFGDTESKSEKAVKMIKYNKIECEILKLALNRGTDFNTKYDIA